jgi:hypothetical protein
MFVGNTAPDVLDTLKQIQSNGSVGPIDLTSVTSVKFRLRSQFGSAVLVDGTAVVTDAPNGKVRYDWILADTTTAIDSSPGPYKAWWHLDFSGTTIDTPEFDVVFYDHAPRRVIGPCTDWCTTQDVLACFSDVAVDACLSSAVSMASEILYELSGRTFSGWCQSVIRPCQNFGCWGGAGVGTQFLSRGHVVWLGRGWRDDNGDPCACGAWLQKIILPGIAQSVVEVLIGGVPLPSSSYRLDPNNELVRTDGGAWPICQNLAANGDQPGTFQVTYQHGYPPNESAKRAAAQLSREFYLACSGLACSLPSGVVEMTRQGIRVQRMVNLFEAGTTGLAMVDSFLAAYGACKPTYVFSPDTFPTSRRTT